MSACRIRTCSTEAGRGKLMCRSHWYQVPKPLRDAIWSTWRTKDMRSYVANVRAAETAIMGESDI